MIRILYLDAGYEGSDVLWNMLLFPKKYFHGFHDETTGLYMTFLAKHHVSFSSKHQKFIASREVAATFFHHPIRVISKYSDAFRVAARKRRFQTLESVLFNFPSR